jgi:hypothetical protein
MIKIILQGRQGLSLIFVLSSMLILLALSVSVLTAAGLSYRVVMAQQTRNRLAIFSSDMERLMHSLITGEQNAADSRFGPITDQILLAVYEAHRTHSFDNLAENMQIELATTLDNAEFVITISFIRSYWVDIMSESVWDVSFDPEEEFPLPERMAYTDAYVASVIIQVEQQVTMSGITMDTRTYYQNMTGRLEETDPPTFDYPEDNEAWPWSAPAPVSHMRVTNRGAWEIRR